MFSVVFLKNDAIRMTRHDLWPMFYASCVCRCRRQVASPHETHLTFNRLHNRRICAEIFTRSSVEDLEYKASVAWNDNLLQQNNWQDRHWGDRNRILCVRRDSSKLAGLSAIYPEIELALSPVIRVWANTATEVDRTQFSRAGRIALSWKLFRIANELINTGRSTVSSAACRNSRSVRIAARASAQCRRDAGETGSSGSGRHTAWRLSAMFSVCFRFSRGRIVGEEWLKAAIAADGNDVESRLVLGPAVFAMGRYQECIQLLETYCH